LQSLQNLVYLICQAISFAASKLHFATLFGVATHSLRSPGIKKNCFKMWFQKKKFEKPCSRCASHILSKWYWRNFFQIVQSRVNRKKILKY